jgi:hypothetical protein
MRKKLIGWIPSILLPNNTKPKSAIIGAEATKGVLLPKSERFYTTMKFFEQLREPERSQAIINYQEVFLEHTVPTTLYDALYNGFLFVGTHQGDSYWRDILKSIENNSYFKEPELLVFGKYKVGDIVVSVAYNRIFKVTSISDREMLTTCTGGSYTLPELIRPATPEEVEAYNQGIRNVCDIKSNDYKEAVHCTTQEEWDFVADKLKRDICYNTKWSTYENKSCVSIDYLIFGKIDNFTGYKILTFQEWCDKYGHVKSPNSEYFLKEVNKRYPIGTKYYSVDDNKLCTVESVIEFGSILEKYLTDGCGGYIYYNGKWAEIVKQQPNSVISSEHNTWIPPQMNTVQMNAIPSPPIGYIIRNIDDNHKYIFIDDEWKIFSYIAQIGDWVEVLKDNANCSSYKKGDIVQCIDNHNSIEMLFNYDNKKYILKPCDYKKIPNMWYSSNTIGVLPKKMSVDQYKEITTSVDNSIKVPTNNLSIPIPTNIVLKNKRKTIKL